MPGETDDVASAVRAVEQVPPDDLQQHVAAFESLHRALQDRLAHAED